MSPWYAKAAVILASIVMIAIRAPHGQRSRSIEVVKDRRGSRETALLTLAMVGFFVPLVWVASPAFAFADYPLRRLAFALGCGLFVVGLWIFHRSHADLGGNWSITLQVRKDHQLVTRGIYRHIRHPMYSGLFLYSLGQALVLPNWLAGPSYLVTFGVLFALRVHAEERMMREEFGIEYDAYSARTKRLVPGVW